MPEKLYVTTDVSDLDIERAFSFITSSYWAQDIPFETFKKAVKNSMCFKVSQGEDLIGFARVVTDKATYAYLCDVFIREDHRGKGLSVLLMKKITTHPDLQGLRRWSLATRDAHSLYEKFGFTNLAKPERYMELHNPDVYKKMHY